MANLELHNEILNQRQTPAFYADTLANIPGPGFVGRIFISTDTYNIYRDNGTTWDILSSGGGGGGFVPYIGANSNVNLGTFTLTSQTLYTENLICDKSLFNMAIGENALLNTVFGSSRNVSIGNESLRDLTVGKRNVAVGYGAGGTHLDSNRNTFIGYQAGSGSGNLVAANDNTAIGSGALINIENGNYNICIGVGSAAANTNGTNNIAIGCYALSGNINESDNIAIGFNTLLNFNLGTNNIAIGHGNLQICTEGNGNTAIGTGAGNNGRIIFGNTYLGCNAGFSIENGNYNTIIGANIFGVDGSNNNIWIGDGDGTTKLHHTGIGGYWETDSPIIADQTITSKTQVRAFGNPINQNLAAITVGNNGGFFETFSDILGVPTRIGFIGDNATNMNYVAEIGIHKFNAGVDASGDLTGFHLNLTQLSIGNPEVDSFLVIDSLNSVKYVPILSVTPLIVSTVYLTNQTGPSVNVVYTTPNDATNHFYQVNTDFLPISGTEATSMQVHFTDTNGTEQIINVKASTSAYIRTTFCTFIAKDNTGIEVNITVSGLGVPLIYNYGAIVQDLGIVYLP